MNNLSVYEIYGNRFTAAEIQNRIGKFKNMTPYERKKMEADSFNQPSGDLKGFDCPKCKNRGYFMGVESHEGRFYTFVKQCDCMKIRQTKEMTEKSGIDKFLNMQFSNFQTTTQFLKDLKRKALLNTEERNTWFFIGGQSGSGKTHICCAIARTFLDRRQRVFYAKWLDDIKSLNFIDDKDYFLRKLGELKTTTVLYIDDLFKAKNPKDITNQDIQTMRRILDYRTDNKLKTIISSEFTLFEILNIDESIGGRIKEAAGEYIFNVKKDMTKNYRLGE